MDNFKIAAKKIQEALAGLEEVSFKEQVVAAAQGVKEALPGKRFISEVFKGIKGYTLEEFKAKLIEAHLAGEVRLVRCDLPYMYDRATVKESHIRHIVADYHFINI